jgi:hypothetical protein
MGFGLVIGFTEHLQIVTTSNYSVITNSDTLQFTTACPVFCLLSSSVIAWRQIQHCPLLLCSCSSKAGVCLTTRWLIQLSCLQHHVTDHTENIIPLLLFNCCLVHCSQNTVPLLLLVGRCLGTATAQLPPSNRSTCHNIIHHYVLVFLVVSFLLAFQPKSYITVPFSGLERNWVTSLETLTNCMCLSMPKLMKFHENYAIISHLMRWKH